jgi:hypothetical protein
MSPKCCEPFKGGGFKGAEFCESFVGGFKRTKSSQGGLGLCEVNKLWDGFISTNPKEFQAFLLELGAPSSHNLDKWLGFWTRPNRIHYAEILPATMAAKCHTLALAYTKMDYWAYAQLLALNGAFMQQCKVSTITSFA